MRDFVGDIGGNLGGGLLFKFFRGLEEYEFAGFVI